MKKLNSFISKQIELFLIKQRNKKKVCNIYFWPACKVVKLKEGNVTLSTSLFMFHLISFSPHFTVHVSSHFLQSTLHWSCFIFISFSPQSISFISPTTVHLIHIYLIWLYLTWLFDHIVIFTFQPIPSLEINDLLVSLDKFLILDRYSLLEAELWCFITPCLFILNKKYNIFLIKPFFLHDQNVVTKT